MAPQLLEKDLEQLHAVALARQDGQKRDHFIPCLKFWAVPQPQCDSCGAVFHSECKVKSVPCPRCVRRELQMKQKSFWKRLNLDESLEEACNMFELSYQNT